MGQMQQATEQTESSRLLSRLPPPDYVPAPATLISYSQTCGSLFEQASWRLLGRALPKPSLQSCHEMQTKLLHGISLLVFTLRSLNS